MARVSALARGIVLGAGFMYLFDPSAGRRRRAILRDKVVHVRKASTNWLVRAALDLEHRLYGSALTLRSYATSAHVPNDVLVERVRARLGRFVKHSHEVEVAAESGRVILRGKVAPGEKLPLVAGMRFVPGVHEIVDELSTATFAEGGLPHVGVLRRTWKPATKLVAGAAGGLGLAAMAFNRLHA